MDEKNIRDDFIIGDNDFKLDFKTCAEKFKIIESKTHDIIIKNEFSEKLIDKIRCGIFTREILRELGQHSVSIYEYEFKKLCDEKSLEIVDEFKILKQTDLYNDNIGLNIFDESSSDCYIL